MVQVNIIRVDAINKSWQFFLAESTCVDIVNVYAFKHIIMPAVRPDAGVRRCFAMIRI